MITVAVPTIAPRKLLLAEALNSIYEQTIRPLPQIVVSEDRDKIGAAANRQRCLDWVHSEWVAFLDDDDLLMPNHLEDLYNHAMDTDADYVFSHYEMLGGTDPMPQSFGVPWDNDHPRQTTITVLVRTELAQSVGFTSPEVGQLIDGLTMGEDYRFTLDCMNAGAKIVHLPKKTWYWRHWEHNTSGLASRW